MSDIRLEVNNGSAGPDRYSRQSLADQLRRSGIDSNDPRLADSRDLLSADKPGRSVRLEDLRKSAPSSHDLIGRVVSNDLVIPGFSEFRSIVEELFSRSRKETGGEVASYIPQLAKVDPELFGVSICTTDGQQLSLGDTAERFCLQSVCKPALYCAVLDLIGEKQVHQHVGWEPSGRSFNELALNHENKPHNPMINAGAIMSSSLLLPDSPPSERFDYILRLLSEFSGGDRPGFDNSVFLSERETANRNYALAHYMKEVGAFPADTNIETTLDLYFSSCAIEMKASSMAMHAATLANAGVCPVTGRRVAKTSTVKNCLSMMYSCGMYDYSGEFAFRVGMPAKSGVSGVVMAVIPNVMGITVYSPRIDQAGNSVRAVEFLKRLVATFNFHNYDSLTRSQKLDPRSAFKSRGTRNSAGITSIRHKQEGLGSAAGAAVN